MLISAKFIQKVVAPLHQLTLKRKKNEQKNIVKIVNIWNDKLLKNYKKKRYNN